MSDETKMCPLCGAALEYKRKSISLGEYWMCPMPFMWATLHKNMMITHYTYDVKDDVVTEYCYIKPYRLKSSSGKTIIHKLSLGPLPGIRDIDYNVFIASKDEAAKYTYWQFIAETPTIKLDATDKVLERIKVLLTFL